MMTSNYARIKFGIGNDFPKGTQVDFVLGTFTEEENKLIEEKIDYVGEMIKSFCLQGLDRTMNQYNKKWQAGLGSADFFWLAVRLW